ncbi:MAG: L,D-transpeptidase family protein [Blastocatellia bacterium]|nr:L,D-transpeptidase family protein [Blastocatellia bacterium]MBO0800895.1 L,D-transpeptidase family protein [Blastocatellia bacterium]
MSKAYLKRLLVLIPALLLLTLLIYANIPDRPLADNVRADKIVVEKGKRKLSLIKSGEVLKSYRVALGRQPVGQKLREGDNKTPEGNFTIDYRNQNSCCHLALHISYPSKSDVERAEKNGINPGGEIMIHGLRAGFGWVGSLHRIADWTRGCIAVTDREIEEICRAVPDGTPIEIYP